MKLWIVALFAIVTFSAAVSAKTVDVEFRGIVDLGDSRVFSLSSKDGADTVWAEEGDVFAGYEIVGFQPEENALILRKDGEEHSLPLGSEKVARGDINSADAVVGASNLRQVAQASLIFANDNDGRLPDGETIHDVARSLAREGGLNDASMWISKGDAESGLEDGLTTILDDDRAALDSFFADQDVVAIDFATGLNTEMRSTTPVAWTRGLREDGTWDEHGVYGSTGGFVVFLGGNVMKYEELTEEGGGLLVTPDGTPTSNILEALPPEARVVGSGPKTLHGSTGVQGDGLR